MEWQPVEYGIVGGSGFYEMPGFEEETRLTLKTPFGDPSDAYVLGRIGQSRVAFLARHGVGHRLLPTEVNFRANVYGFKLLGARAVLSASAVGSLQERFAPGEAVVPDQIVDRTRHRNETFFGGGIVAHVSFADPFCPVLRQRLVEACRRRGVAVHDGGTYLCMEGPLFSTRAESHLYRAWGMDVIGMTGAQEAKLCREAEICYATLALVTDYDCWRPTHASVQIEEVLRILAANTENARAVLGEVASSPPPGSECSCQRSLDHAVITRRDLWPEGTFQRLRPLLGRLLGGEETP